MPFTKNINKDFIIDQDRVRLTSEYLQNNQKFFKKITGTRLAAILGRNAYTSPFKT